MNEKYSAMCEALACVDDCKPDIANFFDGICTVEVDTHRHQQHRDRTYQEQHEHDALTGR